MEIERKWMLKGWPPEELGLPLLYEQSMRQGYISVRPTVRIREEAMTGGSTEYVLCIKSGAGLVRKEIEMDITKDKFLELEDLIGLPLIPKVRRTYGLPDGLKLGKQRVFLLSLPNILAMTSQKSPDRPWEPTGSSQDSINSKQNCRSYSDMT